jgi:hypothetical protein
VLLMDLVELTGLRKHEVSVIDVSVEEQFSAHYNFIVSFI